MTTQPPPNEDEQADLVAYLDGELEPEAAQAIEARISLDPQVRSEADALQRTWDLLDYLPRPEASASFTHQTLERVSTYRPPSQPVAHFRWRRLVLGVGWAAALLVAGVGGFAAVQVVAPRDQTDDLLVRDLRVLEHLRLYEDVDDLEFLRQLDRPDLFGDEEPGPGG